MDATYIDTIKAQISGNALIDYESKEDILKVVDKLSESELIALSKNDKNRFFYKNRQGDIQSALKDKLPDKLKKSLQLQANRAARTGQASSNKFASNFETTYTRGGHKYVAGKRIY